MAMDENPRTDLGDEVPDQENFEVELSDIEDDDRANPETGTSAAGASTAVEEMTDEELLRGAWQGSTITKPKETNPGRHRDACSSRRGN